MKGIRMGLSKWKSKKFKISRFFEIYAISNPIEGRPGVIISRKKRYIDSLYSTRNGFIEKTTQNLPQWIWKLLKIARILNFFDFHLE